MNARRLMSVVAAILAAACIASTFQTGKAQRDMIDFRLLNASGSDVMVSVVGDDRATGAWRVIGEAPLRAHEACTFIHFARDVNFRRLEVRYPSGELRVLQSEVAEARDRGFPPDWEHYVIVEADAMPVGEAPGAPMRQDAPSVQQKDTEKQQESAKKVQGSDMDDAQSDTMGHFFDVPEAYRDRLGDYRSPLVFDDGRKVATPEAWRERRKEILKTWHDAMGPWPPLLDAPRVTVTQATRREDFTQKVVQVEVRAGVMQSGYLLVPDGDGPFPAVLVVYYDGETGAALKDGPFRDYGYQLTKRGFVTLNIGGTGSCPEGLQPLSYLACVAANCNTALARMPEVDGARIGVVGHSFGGKWAMFASCLDERFACGVWSDPGIVFDEKRANVNYWERWYLGWEKDAKRAPGIPDAKNPRTGAYKALFEGGHDLHELHALMAPRPFLVSGGAEDGPARWVPLNHAAAVNRLLGYDRRVGMTNRREHSPDAESNAVVYAFFEKVLKGK